PGMTAEGLHPHATCASSGRNAGPSMMTVLFLSARPRHLRHLSPRAGRGRIPSEAKRSDGIRVRGRLRRPEPVGKPPPPPFLSPPRAPAPNPPSPPPRGGGGAGRRAAPPEQTTSEGRHAGAVGR